MYMFAEKGPVYHFLDCRLVLLTNGSLIELYTIDNGRTNTYCCIVLFLSLCNHLLHIQLDSESNILYYKLIRIYRSGKSLNFSMHQFISRL